MLSVFMLISCITLLTTGTAEASPSVASVLKKILFDLTVESYKSKFPVSACGNIALTIRVNIAP